MTGQPTAPKDDLDDTLAEIRRMGLEHIYRKLPPGNASGIPASLTARPTGKRRVRE